MISHFKIFVLWLLMAALPLQGLAAASAAPCSAARHHGAAAVEASDHHVATHATAAQHADHHHAAPCKQDAGNSASSGCQSCCSGAGLLPSGVNWVLPQHRAGQPQAAPEMPFTGHISGGIERPPRLS